MASRLLSIKVSGADGSPAGHFKIIHSFTGHDGNTPVGNLAEANNGRRYGVNAFGGANNFGTAFSVSTRANFG